MDFLQSYEGIALHASNAHECSKHLLVFFVTGNPGLVHYYHEYLNAVIGSHDRTARGDSDTALHIYSCSLAGYETTGSTNSAFVAKHGQGPYDLEQERFFIDQAIAHACQDLRNNFGMPEMEDMRVVIIGHSLGTYLTLEVLRRSRARRSPWKIVSAILLCPTIMDLAGSPTGKKLALIGSFRFTAPIVAFIAKALCSILSSAWLLWLIQRITGQPPDAARTTMRFLQSPTGVLQALTLARHELRDISVDKWDDNIWGVVAQDASSTKSRVLNHTNPKTKLFLYFAEQDHWIADETRDQIIAARASSGKKGEEDKPVMEIDKTGMPHDFCIRHSRPVAEKTVEYLERIVKEHW